MPNTNPLFVRVALTVALLAGFNLQPQAAEAEANVLAVTPGATVPLALIPDGVFLRVPDDPTATVWDRVPEYQVELSSAAPVHASIALRADAGEPPLPLYFSVVSDRERLYVKLRWVDGSRNVATRPDRFRDGAAVQFALDGGEATSYIMGSTDMPVNIWYWKSDSDSAQNLAAGGFGSTTLLPEQPVSAASHFRPARLEKDNEWVVVMSRPLNVAGDYTVALDGTKQQPLAFAVWQGEQQQRDGNKRVTQGWITLDMSPLAGN